MSKKKLYNFKLIFKYRFFGERKYEFQRTMNFHSSSPTNRFLRQLKQPNSDSNPLELDESDVVCSGDSTGSGSGKFLMSAPVNVPAWPSNGVRRRRSDLDDSDDLEDDTKAEMLPPHEIVARSHVMTFSVVEGVGRTLKGRDLRRVRNAVFQKTGFID
ncbi:unnamed protein product, partial [Vitis vinifera]